MEKAVSNKIADRYKELLEVVNSVLLPAYNKTAGYTSLEDLLEANKQKKIPALLKDTRVYKR